MKPTTGLPLCALLVILPANFVANVAAEGVCTKYEDTTCASARVKRGPDWAFGDQDGGYMEDSIGTVLGGGMTDSCEVQWDKTNSNFYAVGYQGRYELCYYEEKIIAITTTSTMPTTTTTTSTMPTTTPLPIIAKLDIVVNATNSTNDDKSNSSPILCVGAFSVLVTSLMTLSTANN